MKSKSGLWALGLLLVSACASGGGTEDGAALSAGVQTPPAQASDAAPIASSEASNEDIEKDLALLASQERIRPANFYRLERGYEPEVCEVALRSLNKPYVVPEDLHTLRSVMSGKPLGKGDYAAHQAAYYLGTNDNVRWNWRTVNTRAWEGAPDFDAGAAILSLFNDGVDHLVILRTSSLSDHLFTEIFVKNPPAGRVTYRLPTSQLSDLPDRDRINSKFDYSSKDIMKINNTYYTMLMPIQALFKENFVYLFRWGGRPGTPETGDPHDTEYRISCIFSPKDPLLGPTFGRSSED